MRSNAFVWLAALLLPIAGCVGGEGDSKTITGKAQLQGQPFRTVEAVKAAAFDEIRALMEGVPCQSPVTMETSKNLKLLNNVSFGRGGSAEIDIHGDMLLMARGGGFELHSIANPLVPYQLSNWTESGGNLDVKFSPDGTTAFVGGGSVIDIVDITNPLLPERAGQFRLDSVPQQPWEALRNTHMMYTAQIGDASWLFLAPNSNSGVWILKIEGEGATRSLKYVTNTQAIEGGPLGPHDMYVQLDPDLKKWLLYSSDGYHGWEVFDVSDPAHPTLAGGLIRPEGGYTHTIQAAKIGGKRIVATIGEVGANLLEVYDASNLQAPMLLGAWNIATHATPPNPAGLTYPQHNFNIVDGKMYLAHYQSGLFVFDLTRVTMPVAGTMDLEPIAHYASGGAQTAPISFGDFWDAVLKDGVLYGSNMRNGVHIVGFGCVEAGNPLLTSDG